MAVSAFLLLLFISASPAAAKVLMQQKGNLTVTKGEVINDDLFIGSESVDMDGVVNGDVFVGAGTVNINGTVNGNLIIGGGAVTLNGTVKNDVIVGGGNVSVQGAKIGGSLIAGSGTLQIDGSSTVGGSLIAGAGTLNSKAAIGRNAMIGAGSVNLDSKILGEVRVGAGELTFGPDTRIGKDLWYMIDNGKKDLVLPAGAIVTGQINKVQNPPTVNMNLNTAKNDFNKFAKTAGAGLKVISFLGALVVGMLWIKFSGKKAMAIASQVLSSLSSSFVAGLLVLFLTIPLSLILMITIIGFPLALIILAIYAVAFYFTKIVVGLAIGNWLSGKFGWKNTGVYLNFSIGLVVFYLLRMIPVLGVLIGFVVASAGLGAMVLHFKSEK